LLSFLRQEFPAIAFLSDSPALKLLWFVDECAALPNATTIEDRDPLTSQFWKVRAKPAPAAFKRP
jgi:hypothetical protein